MISILETGSLNVTGAFLPESMSLNLSERQSTATLTVGPSAPEISVGDWLRDETDPGKGIVWRVRSVDTQYETETRTIQLEHLINSLRDNLMFGEVKPTDMGGTSAGCTALQAVTYILNRQNHWQIGTFDYSSVSNPYSFNGDDLFSALETVSSSLQDCWWSYSFASYPFTLRIMQKAGTVGTELRLSRNIQTAKHTVDRNRMYTRLYPIGKNNLHIDGDYVSMNEGLYGVISKTETDQSKSTKAELQRWATERIQNHCEPYVTVTVQALDLSDATGETLDRITLGAVCRMPIPGLPAPIQETITRISWPNKIAEPRRATVTLANAREDVASIINNLIKSGGGGGRAGAKNAEEDHAWFVDTTDHVAMIAEGIAGEGADQDWSRVAQLLVDGEGIHQRVTHAQQDIVDAYAEIDVTETRIREHVADVKSGLESDITQSAGQIMSTVQDTLDGFYTQIIQEAEHLVIRTGESTKTFQQMSAPTGSQETPLVEGDIWFKAVGEFTWGGAAGKSWLADAQYTWGEKKSGEVYRYDGQAWKKVIDEQGILEDTLFEQSRERIQMVAGRVDVVGEEIHEYRSEFQVTAEQIRSEVKDYANQQQSMIRQTASEIRMQVSDGLNGMSSSLSVTAREIRAEVADSVNGLSSSLSITAGEIRGEVTDAVNEMSSALSIKADEILGVVSDNKNDIEGKLSVKASEILGVVSDNKNDIEGKLSVKAGEILGVVSDNKSDIEGKLSVQADRISLVVTSGNNPAIKPAAIVTAINGGASSVVISADHINLDGYVKATDIDADFLSARIVTLTGVTLNGVTVNSSAAFNGSLLIAAGSGYKSVKDGIEAVQISGPSNNQYKLQYKKFTDGSWQDAGSFSRAITSMDGAWSNGIYTVTASPQGNTKSSDALTVASGQAYKDGDLLYVPVYAGTTATGYSAWVNWKNLLSSHSNCVAGLTVYNSSSKVELFYKSGETTYRSAGSHYWYYRDTTSSLHTYYS